MLGRPAGSDTIAEAQPGSKYVADMIVKGAEITAHINNSDQTGAFDYRARMDITGDAGPGTGCEIIYTDADEAVTFRCCKSGGVNVEGQGCESQRCGTRQATYRLVWPL